MPTITINSSFQKKFDLVIFYLLILQSLSFSTNASTTTTTMHVTCGTDIELVCPIRSIKKSDEVISWFRPNSSHTRLKLIAIGDILFPEYASIGRFNLISSSTIPRLLISNVLIKDEGFYTCKSSSSGQHSVNVLVNSRPYISPSSPVLLYPVNRTFSLTCSLLCDLEIININNLSWLRNGELLNNDNENDFIIEIISSNTQRLTVYLTRNFIQANYTCRYDGKEASVLVRRRTKEELHRLPRQEGSSAAYLLQTVFDTGQRDCPSLYMTLFVLLLLWFYY